MTSRKQILHSTELLPVAQVEMARAGLGMLAYTIDRQLKALSHKIDSEGFDPDYSTLTLTIALDPEETRAEYQPTLRSHISLRAMKTAPEETSP